MDKLISTRVKQKHDTEALWNEIASTFVPLAGEIIVYDPDEHVDYSRFKIGDGVSTLDKIEFAAITGKNVAYINNDDNENVEVDDIVTDTVGIEPGIGENSIQQADTEALALGDEAAAFNSSIAGCLGFRYKGLDLVNHKIYLTIDNSITYQDIQFKGTADDVFDETLLIDTTLQINEYYNDGDIFSLKTRGVDCDNIGVITDIENNVVTFEPGTIIDTLTKAQVQTEDTYSDRHSFFVPSKPYNGVICVSDNSSAFGASVDNINAATGRFSFVAGRDNLAYGDGSVAMGRDCKAGYGCVSLGFNADANGDRTVAIGVNVTNKGNHSVATGASTQILENGQYSFVSGFKNYVRHPGSAMFGRLNGYSYTNDQAVFGVGAKMKATTGALLVVGNGKITGTTPNTFAVAEEDRSNAFLVWNDGRATVGAAPKNDMDVVNKGSVASIMTNILPLQKGNSTYSVRSNSENCSADAAHSFAFGEQAVVSSAGSNSIALGRLATVRAPFSTAIGRGVITAENTADSPNRDQFVIGRYNEVLDGFPSSGSNSNNYKAAAFIVGVGTSDDRYADDGSIITKNRKNGLVVWGDGRVTAGADPTQDMDVVTKKYFEEHNNSGSGQELEILELTSNPIDTTVGEKGQYAIVTKNDTFRTVWMCVGSINNDTQTKYLWKRLSDKSDYSTTPKVILEDTSLTIWDASKYGLEVGDIITVAVIGAGNAGGDSGNNKGGAPGMGGHASSDEYGGSGGGAGEGYGAGGGGAGGDAGKDGGNGGGAGDCVIVNNFVLTKTLIPIRIGKGSLLHDMGGGFSSFGYIPDDPYTSGSSVSASGIFAEGSAGFEFSWVAEGGYGGSGSGIAGGGGGGGGGGWSLSPASNLITPNGNGTTGGDGMEFYYDYYQAWGGYGGTGGGGCRGGYENYGNQAEDGQNYSSECQNGAILIWF